MPPGFRPQVLNDAFLAAATQARKKTPELTHKQKVRFAVVKKQRPHVVVCFPMVPAILSISRSETAQFSVDDNFVMLIRL